MMLTRSVVWRDCHITEVRHGRIKVRHHRYGLELTATDDGRAAIVTYPKVEDALTAIDATYEPPETPSTPPPPRRRRLRAAP